MRFAIIFLTLVSLSSSLMAQRVDDAKQIPEFKGGDKVMYRWIEEHLEVPSVVIEKNLVKGLRVQLTIDAKGKARHPQRIRQNSDEIFYLAVDRLVEKMPKWKPGKRRGKKESMPVYLWLVFQSPGTEKIFSKEASLPQLEAPNDVASVTDFIHANVDLSDPRFDSLYAMGFNPREDFVKWDFVVEKDGSLSNVTCTTPGFLPSQPLVEVLSKAGLRFKPGLKDSIPVRRLATLRVKFSHSAAMRAQNLTVLPGPFALAETMPVFPGGSESLNNYFHDELIYPEEAVKKGITGVVWVSFIVEVDGSIEYVALRQGIGYGCDEEAIRLVKSMPNWIPGSHRGHGVRVFQYIRVNFENN